MAVYRVTMLTELNSVQTANVMHWRDTVTGANPDREDEVKEWITNELHAGSFAAAWHAWASTNAVVTCVKVQKVDPAPEGTARVFFLNKPGSAGTFPAPSNLAFIIRVYSAVATKRGRGRHFFAGADENDLGQGSFLNAKTPQLLAMSEVFHPGATSPDGSEWIGVIYSGTDDVYRDAVESHYDPVVRNQRPRTGTLCGT